MISAQRKEEFLASVRPADGECIRAEGFPDAAQVSYELKYKHRPQAPLFHTCGHLWCVNPKHMIAMTRDRIKYLCEESNFTYDEIAGAACVSRSTVYRIAKEVLGGRKAKRYRIGDEFLTIDQISERYNIPGNILRRRVRKGDQGQRLIRPRHAR